MHSCAFGRNFPPVPLTLKVQIGDGRVFSQAAERGRETHEPLPNAAHSMLECSCKARDTLIAHAHAAQMRKFAHMAK
jgi:hypothetical protein